MKRIVRLVLNVGVALLVIGVIYSALFTPLIANLTEMYMKFFEQGFTGLLNMVFVTAWIRAPLVPIFLLYKYTRPDGPEDVGPADTAPDNPLDE